jgi:hypothetical protein
MTHQDIENYKVESAIEHADQLLQSAVLAAETYKDEHKLSPAQFTQLVTSHISAAVAYLNRGGK